MPRRLIDNAIDDYVSLATLEVTEDDDEVAEGIATPPEQDDGQMPPPDDGMGNDASALGAGGGLGDALA